MAAPASASQKRDQKNGFTQAMQHGIPFVVGEQDMNELDVSCKTFICIFSYSRQLLAEENDC